MKPDTQQIKEVQIVVDCEPLDVAIEKANRLVELLREASDMINSLCGGG